MRPAFWLAAGGVVLAAIVAVVAILLLDPFSGSDGNGGESQLQRTLRKMVLQLDDLPQGMEAGSEKFITNEDAAQTGADPEEREALLESWGRLLGFEIAYKAASGTPTGLPVQGIDVSAALFETEDGAAESFADAVKTAEETDWAANYVGLTAFQQARIEADAPVDEMVWLRLSGFQPGSGGAGALVTDDIIFFRIDTERGFMLVRAGSTETQDRAHLQSQVEGWLKALAENVRGALPEVPSGDGG